MLCSPADLVVHHKALTHSLPNRTAPAPVEVIERIPRHAMCMRARAFDVTKIHYNHSDKHAAER